MTEDEEPVSEATAADDQCGALCLDCYHHCGKDQYHYATQTNPHVCDGPLAHEWVK